MSSWEPMVTGVSLEIVRQTRGPCRRKGPSPLLTTGRVGTAVLASRSPINHARLLEGFPHLGGEAEGVQRCRASFHSVRADRGGEGGCAVVDGEGMPWSQGRQFAPSHGALLLTKAKHSTPVYSTCRADL